MKETEIYMLGVSSADTTEECPQHGECRKTIMEIPSPEGGTYVPPDGECIHYCHDCLRGVAADMGLYEIEENYVIGFFMLTQWNYFVDYLEKTSHDFTDNDIESLRDERTPDFDGFETITVEGNSDQIPDHIAQNFVNNSTNNEASE